MNQPTADSLREKTCKPCEGGVEPLSQDAAKQLIKELDGWQLDKSANKIHRTWEVKDFMAGVDFLNNVAKVAENENHHPDIHLTGYRNIKVELTTHAIDGLSENDFIVAAKIDELDVELK